MAAAKSATIWMLRGDRPEWTLQKQSPGNEDAKIMLAICLFNLATVSVNSQTLAYELEALPIDEEALRAKPSDPRRQRDVAQINKSIAGYSLGFDDTRALPLSLTRFGGG